MGLKQEVFNSKESFYKIFDRNIEKNGDFITASGNISYDRLIEIHISAWKRSRIDGISASMAFYAEDIEAIKLIDSIAKNYFK